MQNGEFQLLTDSQFSQLKRTGTCQRQTKWIFCALPTPWGEMQCSIYAKTHMCVCYHENKSPADSAAEHALSKLGKSHRMDL